MWSETASPGTILYATSKPSGLVAPCPAHGKPDWKLNEAALHKRRRFFKGLHPKCGESAKITDHWPLSSKALTASATVDVYLPGTSVALKLSCWTSLASMCIVAAAAVTRRQWWW